MKKRKWIILTMIIFPLLIGLACTSGLLPTRDGRDDPTFGVDSEDLIEALTNEVIDHRPEVYAYLGRPDAFDIAIVEVAGVHVRRESWRYYQYGTQVDFVDGSALWVIEIDPMPPDTLFAAWYDPLAFYDGITGSEAVQVAAAASPAGMEPRRIDLAEGGEDLAGGFALVGDQIVIGLYEDQVVYVETIALVPEGGLQ